MRSIRSYVLCLLLVGNLPAQKIFQIIKATHHSFKKFEFYNGDKISIKLKHQRSYCTHIITNMSDSLLLLENDSIIKLSDIKALKFKRGNNAMGGLNKLFVTGAVGIIIINLVSNVMVSRVAMIDPRAMYISGGFVVGMIIFNIWNTKHIRVGSNVALQVLDLSAQNLAK